MVSGTGAPPGRASALAPAALAERYGAARTFADFVAAASANAELWRAVYDRARVSADALARVAAMPGLWHLLVLAEDWCGDAVNSVPVLARLAEQATTVDLRVLQRDANLDLMDRHLTNGSRSIPVVIVLDAWYRERGWWGPRPHALQEWVLGEGRALEKAERYREVRRWYARDRGTAIAAEVIDLIVAAGASVTAG